MAIVLMCRAALAAPPKLPHAAPAKAGMSEARLADIDAAVTEALAAKQMPGCVVLVARQGKIVYLKAFGDRSVEPERLPMAVDTVFDLASLTKPIATATSIMLLVEQGRIDVDDPVAKHIPEFGANGKDKITVRQLLTHQSGLIADNSIDDFADGPAKAIERILALKPTAPTATRFIYSDVGFMVLGELVRRISEQDLPAFTQQHIYQPLGMQETGFLPAEPLRRRAAPTEQREGRWMQGEVHDPRAYALGGAAGHAGLFSTAEDLAVYAQMLLGDGEYGGVRVLASETVAAMETPQETPGGAVRGLGWDMQSGYSSNRGDGFSKRSIGHGGFTGTAFWIDPQRQLAVVFLSNRVHPDGKGNVNRLAGRIGTIAADAIYPEVLTGIDVLVRDDFKPLAGRRIGLITNHTGVDRQGRSTAKLLQKAEGLTLAALFSPEHGIEGRLDAPQIKDGRDPASGLPVFSLYGKARKPTAETLRGIDTLVFDIQDIGARFYTYSSTLGLAMEAAAEHGLRFVVLDRPNPINGVDVDGPLLDAGAESFVGYHTLPVRHGMTVGELARMYNAERKIGVDLQIIEVEGWRREDYFDATGLTWINPSPNMRSPVEALLYPGVGLLETTNVSVGRGTDTPFEVLGAPWIDGPHLARELNHAGLEGVAFTPIAFTPASSKFQDERCGGVNIAITDRRAFRPLRTGLQIAITLRRLYPDAWQAAAYGRLLGSKKTLEAVQAGKPVAEIEALYAPDLAEFKMRRKPFLLYSED